MDTGYPVLCIVLNISMVIDIIIITFRRAEYGQDISTWDTSALSSVLIKTLSNFKDMHGTPSIQDLTKYIPTCTIFSNHYYYYLCVIIVQTVFGIVFG